MEGGPRVMFDGSLRAQGSKNKANAKEWRLFMSARVSDTLREADPQRFLSDDNDKKIQEQEFQKIYKEVEQLGTSQMSWKQRKAVEAKKLLSLGAKLEKGHKMPIEMGRNIKRKREKVEEQKLQEDIALGLCSAKRRKIMIEKRSTTNRGLKASDGIFKHGVLHVKRPVMKEPQNVIHERIAPGGNKKGRRKAGNKGKHKGKRRRR